MTEITDLFMPPKGLLAPVEKKAAEAMARVGLFCGAGIAAQLTEDHWKEALDIMQETPEEREGRLERQRKEAAERAAREEVFKARNRVRYAERTCGNCKHAVGLDGDCSMCKHPDLGEDSVLTAVCMVCDAWAGASEGAEGEEAAV